MHIYQTKSKFLSFVIPCFNCEKFIKRNIFKLIKKLKKKRINYEIILINDGSKDKTGLILNNLKSNLNNLRVFENKVNKGKSYSVIYGIKKTKGKKIIIIDCDLPYFSYLNKVIEKIDKYKLVVVNRKNKKSKLILKNLSFYQIARYLIGQIISYITILFLKIKIKDTQAGLKGFHKSKDFLKHKFISNKFFFDIELILWFQKKSIFPQSIPVKFTIPNLSSINFFNIKKNIEILYELFRVIMKYFLVAK